MEDEYRKEHSIFNGQFKLITEDSEFKMSLWVRGFGIADSTSGKMILELMYSFNLESFEEIESILKVIFKIYPDGVKEYSVEINPFNKIFVYNQQIFALDKFAETFNV